MRLSIVATLLCLFTAACSGKEASEGELKENLSFTEDTSAVVKEAAEEYLRMTFWEDSNVDSEEWSYTERRFFSEYRQFSQLCRFDFTISELTKFIPPYGRFYISIDVKVKARTQPDEDLSSLGAATISLTSVPQHPQLRARLLGGESYSRYETIWSRLTSLMLSTKPSCVPSAD
jgi:hypothetical protein